MSSEPFSMMFASEFRWPRAGDQPFLSSSRGLDNAYIARDEHSRMVMMMTGYKLAADLMVERATQQRFERDGLVYPVIFNYRQFIELSLKYLISTYGHTVDVAANWKSHDLQELWETFTRVLEGYGADDPSGTNPIVAQVVAEFAKVDPRSFSYRYPVDRNGEPIPVANDHLDLVVLADVMQGLDGFFSGCDGYLDSLQSA